MIKKHLNKLLDKNTLLAITSTAFALMLAD